MRSNSYSPSPYSSRKQSHSPTPRNQHHSSSSRQSPSRSRGFSGSKSNFNNYFYKFSTAVIFFFVILYIAIISMMLNPPSRYCTSQHGSFCKACPSGANCTTDSFTCLNNSHAKFFEICHSPGNLFKTENLSLLYKYQTLLYKYVEIQKGKATVDQVIDEKLHLDNEPFMNLDNNDIEIIWTYDNHYYIDDNGFLRFHPSRPVLAIIFSIFYFILFYYLYSFYKHI